MAKSEGFGEDRVAMPSISEPSDNKHDGTGNPNVPGVYSLSPTWGENDFPRQHGSDSLSSDEDLLT